jgi:Ca2+/H+ antiporter
MKKILAPLTLFKHEKAYYLWIFAVILVLGVSLVFPGYRSFFSKGQGIIFIIALIVPFLPELLLPFIIEKKKKNNITYVTFKVVSVLISAFLIVFLFGVLTKIGSFNENASIFWQSIFITISLVFVIYLYAVTKMDTHKDYFAVYDDVPYGEEEKERVSDLEKNAKNRKKVGDISL